MGTEHADKGNVHGERQHQEKGVGLLENIPIYEHQRPHKLDGSVSAAVLLRRIHEKSIIDQGIQGEARTQRQIFAADDASELVKEIVQINTLQKPSWGELKTELSYALGAIASLEAVSKGPEKTRLAKARVDLQGVVDAKVFAAAEKDARQDGKLPAMNEPERLEMAAQAVIAACRQAALFKQMKPGDDMAQARVVMQQIRLHYDVASEGVMGISDRRLLLRLKTDVALATSGMDDIEKFILSTSKPLPWDATFAAGFDAEARFLGLMGSHERPARKYSGNIDPTVALKEIGELGKGKQGEFDPKKDKFTTPQEGVNQIGVVLGEIFARQQNAVKKATTAIAQPHVPDKPGVLDTLLEILIKTALAGAAGAIGSLVSSRVKGALEKSLSTNAPTSAMFKEVKGGDDYFAVRDQVSKDAVSSGAAATTMKTEGAKDAFKEFFKNSGYKLIMAAISSNKGSHSDNTNPLLVFSERSTDVLGDAQLKGRLEYTHLAPALGQASPEGLQELFTELMGQLDHAESIQYSYVMEEWQNFKAQAYNGVSDEGSINDKKNKVVHKQPGEDPAAAKQKGENADAKLTADGRDTPNGALLIQATINTDDFLGAVGTPHVDSMRLPDVEDGTLSHFHHENKTLEQVHMNKQFRLKFVAYMNDFTVNVGVGADHGIQESTLDKRELAALKVIAARDKMNSVNLWAAETDGDPKYATFSKHQLEKVLLKYITVIQHGQKMNKLQR